MKPADVLHVAVNSVNADRPRLARPSGSSGTLPSCPEARAPSDHGEHQAANASIAWADADGADARTEEAEEEAEEAESLVAERGRTVRTSPKLGPFF